MSCKWVVYVNILRDAKRREEYCPIHKNYRPDIYYFGVILGNKLPISVPN